MLLGGDQLQRMQLLMVVAVGLAVCSSDVMQAELISCGRSAKFLLQVAVSYVGPKRVLKNKKQLVTIWAQDMTVSATCRCVYACVCTNLGAMGSSAVGLQHSNSLNIN